VIPKERESTDRQKRSSFDASYRYALQGRLRTIILQTAKRVTYTGLGWQSFKGDVLVKQPRGQVRFDVLDPYVFALRIAPGTGVLDLLAHLGDGRALQRPCH
jgi:hypothetical protein